MSSGIKFTNIYQGRQNFLLLYVSCNALSLGIYIYMLLTNKKLLLLLLFIHQYVRKLFIFIFSFLNLFALKPSQRLNIL